MKIVIVGDGKIGYTLAQKLSKEGHELVLIDNNAAVLQESLETLDVMTVAGNGASLEIQREAGIQNSDLLIAVTGSDEINLLCCILAKKLGCPHTISRSRNPEYIEQIRFLADELGLSMTINPERAAAREIYRLIQFPSFLKRDSFAKGRVELVEVKIEENSPLAGSRLDMLYQTIKVKILVCSVEREGQIIIPRGEFTLRVGDKLHVTAPGSELAKLIKNMGITRRQIRDVILIGGSRTAVYLSEDLLHSGINVKIIEHNQKRCEQLAAVLPEAVIINGDGTRQELLISEGIRETDAVITLTDIDEENLIISMFAEHEHVPKTITKINRTEYSSLFPEQLGSIICPKELTANEITRYVRAMVNAEGGSLHTLHRLFDGKAEALEFIAPETSALNSKPLMLLPLRRDILIASITRRDKVIIPSGNDHIEAGDSVVVFTTADKPIYELEDILNH